MKAIKAPDVEVVFLDSSIISSMHKKDGKYIIKINSDLQINLIRYFILHELAHILSGDVTDQITEGNPKNFEFEFEEVDLIALKTYMEKDFDCELIKESPFLLLKEKKKDLIIILEMSINKWAINIFSNNGYYFSQHE